MRKTARRCCRWTIWLNACEIHSPGSGQFGCSIDPRQENLAKTSEFLASTRLTNKPFRDGLKKSIGLQDINVFGIDPASRAAQILVEADYRMKCIALGVEKSISEVPSYWDRLDLNDELPPELGLARWWFTVNYSAVAANPDKTIFAIRGQGVKVLSEDEMLARNGQRIHTGVSTGASKSFADDFTLHFNEMCQVKPVFAELRNVFDTALVGAIIAQQLSRDEIETAIDYFGPAERDGVQHFVYQTKQLPHATTVDSVINHRYYETRKNGVRQRHMVVAVGGGVDFNAKTVLKEHFIVAEAGQLESQFPTNPAKPNASWWHD